MARTYANFLLFEGVLDNLPSSADPVMLQAVQILFNPSVTVVAKDCATLLGELVTTNSVIEGYIEVATGSPLTQTRINQLLSQGKYITGTRNLHSCLSSTKGGICQVCFQGSFVDLIPPPVGVSLSLQSYLIFQTDVIRGDGINSNYALSQIPGSYGKIVVIQNGIVLPQTAYVIAVDPATGSNSIQFPGPVPVDPVTGVYTVHYYENNSNPFLGYISKTFSGGLLGMNTLPTNKTLLRRSLYEALFSDSFVASMRSTLNQYKLIPATYLNFLDNVPAKLEKVLLMLYIYAIYVNGPKTT